MKNKFVLERTLGDCKVRFEAPSAEALIQLQELSYETEQVAKQKTKADPALPPVIPLDDQQANPLAVQNVLEQIMKRIGDTTGDLDWPAFCHQMWTAKTALLEGLALLKERP